jgi:hypothetical protein
MLVARAKWAAFKPRWKTLLGSLTLGLLLVFGPVQSVSAQQAADKGAAVAVQQVISDQIKAFGQDDAETAFSFASNLLRDYFDDPQTFLGMVKVQYPMVYRPKRFQFEETLEFSGVIVQNMVFQDAKGVYYKALYALAQEDQKWKIISVQVVALIREGSSAA